MTGAKCLVLRKSRPGVQRSKDALIRETKVERGRRKVAKAVSRKLPGDAAEAAEGWRPADYAGFANWYGITERCDLLVGLSQAEKDRVREAAWGAYHGGLAEQQAWSKVLGTLHERHREAGVAVPSYTSRKSWGIDHPRTDGW